MVTLENIIIKTFCLHINHYKIYIALHDTIIQCVVFDTIDGAVYLGWS